MVEVAEDRAAELLRSYRDCVALHALSDGGLAPLLDVGHRAAEAAVLADNLQSGGGDGVGRAAAWALDLSHALTIANPRPS